MATDYSQTKIYRLVCKDPTITDCYVGHTTGTLTRRKAGHKNQINANDYKSTFIREHGGFDNWDIILIEEFPCENKYEACRRERHFIEELKPTLNKNNPALTEEERANYAANYVAENVEYFIQYRRDHRDVMHQQCKDWKQAHVEQQREYNRNYQRQYGRFKREAERMRMILVE